MQSLRTAVASLIALVMSVMPAFMLGGVAVLVRQDLGFSESRLGIAVSSFYASSTLVSVAGGRLSERLGGVAAARLGVIVSTAALLAVAAMTQTWWHLLVWMSLAGAANAVIQPATSLALAEAIPLHRQGIAFGFKQTNAPVATLIAGASAPVIGVTHGWRWSFATVAVIAILFLVVAPSTSGGRPAPASGVGPPPPRRALLLIAVGGGLGVATAMALVGFYVESAVSAGYSIELAGLCLAIGSAVGTVARVFWGWLADARGSNGLRLVGLMLCVGAIGFALLGVVRSPGMLIAVTISIFVLGWGWVGLLLFAVARISPGATGYATGIVNAGTSFGGILGPFAFGVLVEQAGYPTAWAGAAASAFLAGTFVLVSGRFTAGPAVARP